MNQKIINLLKVTNILPKNEFFSGDFIKITYFLTENTKRKYYSSEGIILKSSNKKLLSSILLQINIQNYIFEQLFYLNNPNIVSITKLYSIKTRRNKLYYLRKKSTLKHLKK